MLDLDSSQPLERDADALQLSKLLRPHLLSIGSSKVALSCIGLTKSRHAVTGSIRTMAGQSGMTKLMTRRPND